jgi:hypothetical protein
LWLANVHDGGGHVAALKQTFIGDTPVALTC